MSKHTGPVTRGTKKDGSPRVYQGQLPSLAHSRPMTDDFIVVAPGDPGGFVWCKGPDQTTAYSLKGVTADGLHALDVGLDYFDAANEDAHGRLPHNPGFGTPLVLVPDPPANVVPLPAVRSDAA